MAIRSLYAAMSTTARSELEQTVKQLPEQEVRDFARWLQDYLDDLWDQQIETDVAAGRLDHLIAQAEADIAAGRVQDLDEVLHHR
ncbi:MAG: hypothetical protein AAGG51_11495 [Cyanobacteria bacterium P01_G01_bin.54]